MTECQGCGAWNDAARIVCVLCGTPLAETDEWDTTAEPPPLPPLPDGGLSASMPAWLREAPAAAWRVPDAATTPEPELAAPAPARQAPGSRADPRTFLTDDDFPHWLRALAARQTAVAAPNTVSLPAATRHPGTPRSAVPPARSGSAMPVFFPAPPAATAAREAAAPATIPAETAPLHPVPRNPAAPTAAPDSGRNGRRARSVWEVLLLIMLVVAVVGAALWALVSSGVLSAGL